MLVRTFITIVFSLLIREFVNLDQKPEFEIILATAAFVGGVDTIATSFYPVIRFMYLQIFIFGSIVLFSKGLLIGNNPHYGLSLAISFYLLLRVKIGSNLNLSFIESLKVQDSLEEEKKSTEEFINLLPAHVAWLDPYLNFKIANEQLAKMFELDLKNKNDHSIHFWRKAKENKEFYEHIFQFIYSFETTLIFETQFNVKNENRWFQVLIKKIENKEYSKNDFFIVMLDINNHKIAEKELEEQKTQNAHAARLATLGEVSAGIAHEVKNPLSIIGVTIQLLEREINNNKFTQESILKKTVKVKETIQRIVKIIDSMRRLARDNSNEDLEWVSLEQVIEDPLEIVREKMVVHNIDFKYESLNISLELFCRHHQVSQVILNMVKNAIEILDEKNIENKKIWVTPVIKQDSLEIQIIDNGPGVAHPEKLFKPYYTTKSAQNGTGLGLGISIKIMEACGGRLEYRREKDLTYFCLVFPVTNMKLPDNFMVS